MTDAKELVGRLREDAAWSMQRIAGTPRQIGMDCASAADLIERQAAAIERARWALGWYAEMVADCRKITTQGQNARSRLDMDGGANARAVLAEMGEGK